MNRRELFGFLASASFALAGAAKAAAPVSLVRSVKMEPFVFPQGGPTFWMLGNSHLANWEGLDTFPDLDLNGIFARHAISWPKFDEPPLSDYVEMTEDEREAARADAVAGQEIATRPHCGVPVTIRPWGMTFVDDGPVEPDALDGG